MHFLRCAAAFLLLGTLCLTPRTTQAQHTAELTTTATARLLAGLEPTEDTPSAHTVMKSDAWKEHRQANQAGIHKLRAHLSLMNQWQAQHLGPYAPENHTLIYPFSGPDFINAYTLFPNADTYVFFNLEEPGAMPQLERMSPAEHTLMFRDLRVALNDLVHLNFFITPNMKYQVGRSTLKGTLPVLLAMMGMLEMNVLRVQSVDLWPERTQAIRTSATMTRTRQPRLPLRAVQIDFQNPAYAGQRVQSLFYFCLDISDAALPAYPEFIEWLRRFQSPAVLLKSASYLLHGKGFSQVRNALLDGAGIIVQDDTGVPYRQLLDAGLTVRLYGKYETPVQLVKQRRQDDLIKAFKASAAKTLEPLPFPFGYNWRKEGKAFVMVARREPHSSSAPSSAP